MVYAIKITGNSFLSDDTNGSQTSAQDNQSNNGGFSNVFANDSRTVGNLNSSTSPSSHRASGIFYGNFIYLPWLNQSSSWSNISIPEPVRQVVAPKDLHLVSNNKHGLGTQHQSQPSSHLSYEVVLKRNQNELRTGSWTPLTEPFSSHLQFDQISNRGSDAEKIEDISEPEDMCHKEKRVQNKTPRKPMKPQRSAERTNPDFRGITFSLKTEFKEGLVQLKIDSDFSPCKTNRRKLRPKAEVFSFHHNSSGSRESATDSESDEPRGKYTRIPYQCYTHHSGKQCASCNTRKTPLWRDAEDGTPLCNACGIRYKKYRLRCSFCWHIPRKGSKAYPRCARCGEMLRLNVMKKLF
ncbi:uncharacterized protein LOC106151859 isoform X2 [Lingula anatina]|uniref:Uncharacterized protein LOC106151859 isoform X2 n=1 Tax=Lingula anatina TaxID=7574 RepID=A0A1S3H5J7_LINAN|nr:uncharacterized protein LOC106151859 isoform X2 [Lingula anatina]|eukprot:XP_013380736.1 uncharacterized protein LOC106151859 isoform X2 [Lingula anatina]